MELNQVPNEWSPPRLVSLTMVGCHDLYLEGWLLINADTISI